MLLVCSETMQINTLIMSMQSVLNIGVSSQPKAEFKNVAAFLQSHDHKLVTRSNLLISLIVF